MWEAIKIAGIAIAGIIIGLTFGYICGHNRGWEQANEWRDKEEMAKSRYGG